MKASPLLKVLRAPSLAADARSLGPIVLFYALLATVLVVLGHSFALDSFEDRVISQATLDNYEVAGRTTLYVTAVGVLFGAGAVGWILSRGLARVLPPASLTVLRQTSIAGLLLLLFGAYGSPSPLALTLLVTLHLLIVLTAVLGRRGELPHPDRAAYLAWLLTGGFAFVFVAFDYWEDVRSEQSLGIALIAGSSALVLHLLLTLAGGGGDVATVQRRSARWLWASLPLAFVPLVSLLRDEAYMQMNSRRVFSLTPHTLGIAMYAVLVLWIAWRWSRNRIRTDSEGRFDLERLVGGTFFPVLVLAAVALNKYLPARMPSGNFLEPANSGLLIQQWLQFGRLPFFETFNAHGFSDSFFGLIYALVNTNPGPAFKHYDFGYDVINYLLVYALMRRVTRSPYPALFTVLLLPHFEWVFPPYCAVAITTIFVLQWVVRRADYPAWTLLFLYLGFSLIWRLDVGFSSIAATFVTLLALWLTKESFSPKLLAVAGGAITAAIAFGAAAAAIAAARGLDLKLLGKDFANITLSNQAFGYSRLAKSYNEVVLWHLAVVPACIIMAGLYLLYRYADRDRARRPSTFLFTALVFMSAYYFANVPRGLVRHTFVEPGNVYIVSFSIVVLSAAAFWVWNIRPQAMRFVLFVLIASTVTYGFNLEKPTGSERYMAPMSLVERLPKRIAVPGLQPSGEVISRTLLPQRYKETHLKQITSFLRNNLGEDETFLDLANSPVLYTFTHKLSPHYANHVMLAHNEYLQLRFLEQLADFDVPLVLMPAEDELYQEQGVSNPNHVDGVPVALRQYRLHEYVYEHYRPLAIVNRWQVWSRKGWAPRIRPRGSSYSPLFEWRADPPRGSTLERGMEPGLFSVLGLYPRWTYFAQVTGEASRNGRIALSWIERRDHETREVREWIEVRQGKNAFFYVFPYDSNPRSIKEFSIAGVDAEFALDTLEIVRGDCPEFAATAGRLLAAKSLAMRRLPYVWGQFDEQSKAPDRVLRRLIRSDDGSLPPNEQVLTLRDIDERPWIRGIDVVRSACLLAEESLEQSIVVGDTLAFAGGEHEVTQVLGRRVWVDGKLEPQRDGFPAKVVWRRHYKGIALRLRGSARLPMQPVEAVHQGHYLRLSMTNLDGDRGLVAVDFGSGEHRRGQFTFFLEADKQPHEYLIRLSTQYNWHAFPNDWIEITSHDVQVTIEAADLIEGD